MKYVRSLVQECRPGTIEALTRKAEQTLIPRVRAIPGFLGYEIAKVDDRTLFAIGHFRSREGCEELERIGAEWRKQYGGNDIVSFRQGVGEVILDVAGVPEDVHPSL